MGDSKNITVIPARKNNRKSNDEEKQKLRVAAYCRVSTDSDEQVAYS
jgi:site-specific DNA recombinase